MSERLKSDVNNTSKVTAFVLKYPCPEVTRILSSTLKYLNNLSSGDREMKSHQPTIAIGFDNGNVEVHNLRSVTQHKQLTL